MNGNIGKFAFRSLAVIALLQPIIIAHHADAMGAPAPRNFSPSAAFDKTHRPELVLVRAIDEIKYNHLNIALGIIDQLLKTNPDFKLANLIRGDLLLARTRPLTTFGAMIAAPRNKIANLRQEALVRLQRYQEPPPTPTRVPAYLLQMAPSQHYAVVVDADHSRLYVYRNDDGTPRYYTDYYLTIGKNGVNKVREGDKRTPRGVYFITRTLHKNQLTDIYGPVAFPLNYPNAWDRRMGRSGYGIWLHGSPSTTYSRPPRDSNGCLVLPNQDIDVVRRLLQVEQTPVIISDTIQWVKPASLDRERTALRQQLTDWRRDWESRNIDSYLSHYSAQFKTKHANFAAWSRQKRRVNAGKSWIKIKISDVSIFRYPGNSKLAIVTFNQDYRSNNLDNKMRKRQYWLDQNGRWKIIYEGAA